MALEHSSAYLSHEKGIPAAAAVAPGEDIYGNGKQRGCSYSCSISKSLGNGVVKPDPERMRALNEFLPPNGYKALRRVLGMFAHYAKWIDHFVDKVRSLAVAKNFPLSGDALNSFKLLNLSLQMLLCIQ